MDIRHLRYFVAVAEQLSFGAAARQLHISQPPLSKRIAELEQKIGVRLFDRTTRSVQLTAAGVALLPDARAAVLALDKALQTAAGLRLTGQRKIRIAFTPDTSREVLLAVVAEYQKSRVEVEVTEAATNEQATLIATGQLDVGVMRHPFDTTGLRCTPELRQTLGIVLHKSHPLASRRRIGLDELQESPLVMFPRSVAPGLYDEILAVCRARGYSPTRIVHGMRMVAGMLVAEGAVTLSTRRATMSLFGNLSDIRWKSIKDEPLHWWTSAVSRLDTNAPVDVAMNVIPRLLERYEGWIASPRVSAEQPAPARRRRSTAA